MRVFLYVICIFSLVLTGCTDSTDDTNKIKTTSNAETTTSGTTTVSNAETADNLSKNLLKEYLQEGGKFSDMNGNVNQNFVDPYSLQYSNWREPYDGGSGSTGRCVDINAKNSYGGYTGQKPYIYFYNGNIVSAMYQTKCK